MIIRTEHEKHEDATASALIRLIKNLFCPSSNELSLTFLETSVDREYWVWSALTTLMKAGATVHGTVKRCGWFPCTCAQVLKKNDKR